MSGGEGRAGQNAQFAGTGQRADSVHLVEKLCSFWETGAQGEPVDGSRGRWFAAGAWGRACAPRIHRLPGGLPWTAQHYCPVVSGQNCFQALASRGPSRWPAGCGGRGAGAAGRAPASSGGVLESFLVRHVGVSTLCDEARAGMCASCRGYAIFEHTCRRSWRYRAIAGLHSSSKDCTACVLYLCTAGRRQTMTCVASRAMCMA
jgi:hypothetical protein